MKKITETSKLNISLVEIILSEEKCGEGMYWCNTNKECKPLPSGFNTPGQKIKPTEVGIGVPVEGSCNHTKKGKTCPIHGKSDCTVDDPVDEACWVGYKQVGMKKKGKKIVPNCVKEEGLRKWFKGSSSKDGKGGWVNVVTGGTCASDEPGEGVPKCVSSSKRASMTPAERRSAAARKKRQDPGQQSKSGASNPTYVSTDFSTKKMNENHNAIASGKEKDEEGYMASTEMDTINSAVKKLRKNIKKGDAQLPAWVQSKITKAADYIDTAADYMDSNEMSEESDKKTKGSGTKDACYTKVKSRYSVWPSAYASGALVKCRKVGAANWGNKSESYEFSNWRNEFKAMEYEFIDLIKPESLVSKVLDEKCWPGYKKKGMKTMFGKRYPNCVKTEEKNTCNHTYKGDECPMHGKKECPDIVDEAVRIPAKTGNIILVILNWRGKYYMMKMFFPQITKPSRSEVQDQIEKVYPGAKVQSYQVSDIKPGEQFLHTEDWQKVNRQDKTDGLSSAAVKAYRSENPGSKLQTAVTEKKPTGKRAQRRLNFCSRMKGMKSKLTSAKTSRDPDSRINKALRRWNCS